MLMDEAKYVETQKQIELFTGLLKGLDLDGFLERLDHSEAIGPLVDPTLYREALQSGKLDLVRDLAQALGTARHEIMKAEKRFEEQSKPQVRKW